MLFAIAVGGIALFLLGFWLGQKDTEAERELSFLQGTIIHHLEVYLRSKRSLTLAEEVMKARIEEMKEML